MELNNEKNGIKLNINAPEFKENSKKTAAAIALMKIKEVRENESDSD